MTLLISRVLTFTGRHWLRLCIIGGALFLLTDKQVNFNIKLGGQSPPEHAVPAKATDDDTPAPPPAAEPRPPILTETQSAPEAAAAVPREEKAGLLERFNLFGSNTPSAYDLLTRQEEQVIAAFVRRFSNVAQAEQEKYGIPASIVLASGLLHGRAGQADAAKRHNAYFGLGCADDWPGITGRSGGQCYRAYENAWTSFRDHSLYVTSGKFEPLTRFGETDYRRWAAGLEELGYNGTDDLAQQLLRTIDKYQLFRFD